MAARKSKQWQTFLRIPEQKTSDAVPLDPAWLQSRGIGSESAVVLRLLKEHVVPLVRRLGKPSIPNARSFHFLIHDRDSGVPTKEPGAFIHLRQFFHQPATFTAPAPFILTGPVNVTDETMAGVDLSMIDGGIDRAIDLLGWQSAWLIDFLESHTWTDDLAMLRQTAQFFHYLSNMAQMTVR